MEAVDAFVPDRVGAHLVEQAPVRSLADEVVVHGAEDGAEAVRVGDGPLGITAARAVADRPRFRRLHGPLEEPVLVAQFQATETRAVDCERGNFLRARDEAADVGAGRQLVDAENGKRVCMPAFQNRLDLRQRDFPGGSPVVGRLRRCLHQALQISDAYWRMVLSEENHPIRAVLRIVFECQDLGSAQIWSTVRCAAA